MKQNCCNCNEFLGYQNKTKKKKWKIVLLLVLLFDIVAAVFFSNTFDIHQSFRLQMSWYLQLEQCLIHLCRTKTWPAICTTNFWNVKNFFEKHFCKWTDQDLSTLLSRQIQMKSFTFIRIRIFSTILKLTNTLVISFKQHFLLFLLLYFMHKNGC